jgi:hypothetical protein
MSSQFNSFSEFYPYYLEEHRNSTCRKLHFAGSWLVLAIIVYSIWQRDARWLLLAPLVGYGFAWLGHFFFEKNRPATFKYPFYSLAGDWVLWKDLLLRKQKF